MNTSCRRPEQKWFAEVVHGNIVCVLNTNSVLNGTATLPVVAELPVVHAPVGVTLEVEHTGHTVGQHCLDTSRGHTSR